MTLMKPLSPSSKLGGEPPESATHAAPDYLDVTEVAGEPISAEQLERLRHRYVWALRYCRDRGVVECACGTGPGLGILMRAAASLHAGDVSAAMVERARAHYRSRVTIDGFDAQSLPFAAASKDVVILFEAIYYLPDAGRFVAECRRVLRPGGRVLIATANKDLPDFNPSPYSHRYYGSRELAELFGAAGFEVELFGHMSVDRLSLRQRALRPVKQAMVRLGLMPRTMRGKRLLKRLVFGRSVPMPAELGGSGLEVSAPEPLDPSLPDTSHKVIYAVAVAPRA